MDGLLFSEHGPLSIFLAELERLADQLVDEMAEDELLDRPPQEHAHLLGRRLMPQVPNLLVDRATPRREVMPGEAFMVFTIPFSGTAALFSYTPQGRSDNMPRGIVSGVLRIAISMTDRDSDAIEAAYQAAVGQIAENLRALEDELVPFAADLSERLLTTLATRWNRVVKEQAVAEEVVRRFSIARVAGSF